tara:strand:- start:29913 stop:31193 length:1281 start_codon:yes stop_codon:yes gene_type:complete
MKIKYVYSACIEIKTKDLTILCDPWFTDGVYHGTWYQYPKIDPFEIIDKPDVVYISHIHPDHYDPIFLRKLLEKFPNIKILISFYARNYLKFKMLADGFSPIETDIYETEHTILEIIPADLGNITDIDSALIVFDKANKKTLLNTNDCIYDEPLFISYKESVNKYSKDLDIATIGYTGAGPYPQMFYDESEKTELLEEADKKKKDFFNRYMKAVNLFNPKYTLPFAGTYYLGGKLATKNFFRGNADALECKEFDDTAVILKNGGTIDLVTENIKNERKEMFSEEELKIFFESIEKNKLDHENEILIPYSSIKFPRLISKAIANAENKISLNEGEILIFEILDECENVKSIFEYIAGKGVKQVKDLLHLESDSHTKLLLDYRLFYGLMTGVYHWNNAEVGSLITWRRSPKSYYLPEVRKFLNFLTVF